MKKYILIISILLLTVLQNSKAQDPWADLDAAKEEIASILEPFNVSNIPTGYFLNRAELFYGDFDQFNSYTSVEGSSISVLNLNISSSEWKDVYFALNVAALDESKFLDSIFYAYPLSLDEQLSENIVPIGIINVNGNYLTDEELSAGQDGNFAENYEVINVIAASVLREKVWNNTVVFEINPEYILSNSTEEFTQVQIDFSDGMGFQDIELSYQQYLITYDGLGEKSIAVKLSNDKREITCYSIIDVEALSDGKKCCRGLDNDSADIVIQIDPTNFGHVFLSEDNVFDKPFIISRGFPYPGEPTEMFTDAERYQELYDIIKGYGFDLVRIEYEDASQSMLRKAQVVKDLVKKINEQKEGNFESIYLGQSQGGVIGKIAFSELENEGYDSNLGLFIAFDSPFQGANVTPGFQVMAIAINEVLSHVSSAINLDRFSKDLGKLSKEISQYIDLLKSDAAKESLVRHLDPSTREMNPTGKTQFHEFLDSVNSLGHADIPRKVALINGHANAIGQAPEGFSQGDEVFKAGWNWLNATVTTNDLSSLSTIAALNLKFGPFKESLEFFWLFDNKPWDVCAGGNFDIPKQFSDKINEDRDPDKKPLATTNGKDYVSFSPTWSTLDMDIAGYTPEEYFSFYNESSTTTEQTRRGIIESGLTPFDDIYAAEKNTHHTWLHEDGDFEIPDLDLSALVAKICENDIMYHKAYLQNRTITNATDFEAKSTAKDNDPAIIIAGNNVTPVSLDKVIAEGDFIIDATGDVTFYAEEISLEPGFEVKPGGRFSTNLTPKAKKAGSNSMLPTPHFGGTFDVFMDENTVDNFNYDVRLLEENIYGESDYSYEWEVINTDISLTGKEVALPSDIETGTYTFKCKLSDNNDDWKTFSKVIVVDNQKSSGVVDNIYPVDFIENSSISIFPNPVNSEMNVKIFAKENAYAKIELFDITGKQQAVIYSENNLPAGVHEAQIDMSEFDNGLYIVSLTINDKTESKKLIISR